MRRSLIVAAVVSAFALVAAGSASPAGGSCAPVHGTAQDAASSPAGPFVGSAELTIGGVVYEVGSVTNVLAPLVPAGSSGVLFTTTSHTYTSPSLGTITTLDDARLIPTQEPGVYHLVAHLDLTSGATGVLNLQATVNLITLTASGSYDGAVCGLS